MTGWIMRALAMLIAGVPVAEPAVGAALPGSIDGSDRTTRSLEAVCLAEQGASAGWCSAYLVGVCTRSAAPAG